MESIPLGQFQRLRRYVIKTLITSLGIWHIILNRGNIKKKRVVDQALNKMTITMGWQTQKKKKKKKNRSKKNSSAWPYFAMDKSTVSDEIQCLTNRNWGIIQSDPSLCEFFKNLQLWATERLPRSRIKLWEVICLLWNGQYGCQRNARHVQVWTLQSLWQRISN